MSITTIAQPVVHFPPCLRVAVPRTGTEDSYLTNEEKRKRAFSLHSNASVGSINSLALHSTSHHSCNGSSVDDESSIAEEKSHVNSMADGFDDDDSSLNPAESSRLAAEDWEWDPAQAKLVQDSWLTLQTFDAQSKDYRQFLGDTLLLRMMEVDPGSRAALCISSFQSPRYGQICHLLAEGIGKMVQTISDSASDEKPQLAIIGSARRVLDDWRRQGVHSQVLVQQALLYAIQASLPLKAWTSYVH